MTRMNERKLSDRIPTTIHEFVLDHQSHGRRGQPRLPKGTPMFAIAYSIGGFFTYSYTTREAAEQSRRRQIENETNTYQFYQFNCVADVQRTMPCSKTAEELG